MSEKNLKNNQTKEKKHKICNCAGRYECHECGLPCYSDNPEEWKQRVEQEDCEL